MIKVTNQFPKAILEFYIPLSMAIIACLLSLTLFRCVSSNCYTARTLGKGHTAFSPGLDYIAIFNEKKD